MNDGGSLLAVLSFILVLFMIVIPLAKYSGSAEESEEAIIKDTIVVPN